LIKHRDEHAREGNAGAILAEDRSIASGRPMAAIAAGKGRGPKPFMLAGKAAAEPDAVWHSRSDPAAENHKKRKAGSAKTSHGRRRHDPLLRFRI
jgi:bifunctional non-homologous end joining protein LigD